MNQYTETKYIIEFNDRSEYDTFMDALELLANKEELSSRQDECIREVLENCL